MQNPPNNLTTKQISLSMDIENLFPYITCIIGSVKVVFSYKDSSLIYWEEGPISKPIPNIWWKDSDKYVRWHSEPFRLQEYLLKMKPENKPPSSWLKNIQKELDKIK